MAARTTTKQKKPVVITTKAKKKRAVARATLRSPGQGIVRINSFLLDVYPNRYVKMIMEEPLILAGEDVVKSVDIHVTVHGGGFMGQAVAVRGAIAKALAEFVGDELREKYLAYDRTLLVDDVRRVEPKKPMGRKARAKKQTSYR